MGRCAMSVPDIAYRARRQLAPDATPVPTHTRLRCRILGSPGSLRQYRTSGIARRSGIPEVSTGHCIAHCDTLAQY
eukprot:351593-Rhodomonas_salina.1